MQDWAAAYDYAGVSRAQPNVTAGRKSDCEDMGCTWIVVCFCSTAVRSCLNCC
jgi:hypothetical protein